MLPFIGRQLVRAGAGLVLLAGVAGVPAWLVIAFRWPLPDHLPSFAEFQSAITHQVSDRVVLNLIAVATWIIWALFAHAVAAEARDAIRGIRTKPHTLNPLRVVAGFLISAMMLGSILTATAAASSPASARPAPAAPTMAKAAAVSTIAVGTQQGPATIHIGDTSYVYVVQRGDYLSKIAKTWLGDADRWPEICEINKHRHFPKVGGTLRNCNLIYPGWDLRLPADAKPPADATPVRPPTQPVEPPVVTTPPTTDDGVTEPGPAVTPSHTANPTTSPSTAASSSPSASPSAAPSPSTSASPAPTGSPAASPAPTETPAESPVSDEHGVQLPDGSWVPWAVAVAISAAAAMVWLQRRRRYTGEPDDDPPMTELATPVTELRRAVIRNPQLPAPTDDAEQAASPPALAELPPGGMGLKGDGAHAAARAALVAVLSSGGPDHPDARGEVVIDAATLTTLIGSDAVALGPWPRLHIADDTDHALSLIEARLLYRSRILDEHALTDLDTLRREAPDEEALPPVLLVCETPPAGARMRTKASLALGSGLHVSALLLGEWAHGATVEVTADGHTRLLGGQTTEPVPPRLPVVQADAAVQILMTLREAHTGEPPTVAPAAYPTKPIALVESRATPAPVSDSAEDPRPLADAAVAGGAKARLTVLGPPGIQDITAPGRPLRAKALELAVFLACHPDGLAIGDIGKTLEPDARIRQADQRVHTNASNLRHVLGRAADPNHGYVIKASGRYRLDPATVDVDIWQLRDLMRTATIASGERRRTLLQQACDLYTAPLAEGQDYDWVEPHREAVRRWGTEAHLLLADDLLDAHPQEASDLLDKAIGLDRYNEQLYRKAMHARHSLGDADGIRTLLRALSKSLADLDAEPQEETIVLATQLRTSLERR